MPKFRKKPVEVIAHRIGDDGWPEEIWDGVNRNEIILRLDRVGHPKRTVGHVEIETREGVMRGEVGDWIIMEPNPTDDRRFYPCKPEIFEATYEPVDERPPGPPSPSTPPIRVA